MKRKCTVCEKELNLSSFHKNGTIKGKEYRRHQCKDCFYQIKKSKNQEMAKWILETKKTLKCQACGNDDFRVLEFDHLNNKEFNIGDAINNYGKERIIKEMEKCQVLCANCHRIKTYNDRNSIN